MRQWTTFGLIILLASLAFPGCSGGERAAMADTGAVPSMCTDCEHPAGSDARCEADAVNADATSGAPDCCAAKADTMECCAKKVETAATSDCCAGDD